jgi:hypothetical protein
MARQEDNDSDSPVLQLFHNRSRPRLDQCRLERQSVRQVEASVGKVARWQNDASTAPGRLEADTLRGEHVHAHRQVRSVELD